MVESKIIKQEKNPLLGREEYMIEITSNTNPSFDDVKKIVGKDENLTIVKGIKGNFGRNIFTAEVYVYDSLEQKKKVEKDKKKGEEQKPASPVAVVDKKSEEAPKEKKKEMKTEENKGEVVDGN